MCVCVCECVCARGGLLQGSRAARSGGAEEGERRKRMAPKRYDPQITRETKEKRFKLVCDGMCVCVCVCVYVCVCVACVCEREKDREKVSERVCE